MLQRREWALSSVDIHEIFHKIILQHQANVKINIHGMNAISAFEANTQTQEPVA